MGQERPQRYDHFHSPGCPLIPGHYKASAEPFSKTLGFLSVPPGTHQSLGWMTWMGPASMWRRNVTKRISKIHRHNQSMTGRRMLNLHCRCSNKKIISGVWLLYQVRPDIIWDRAMTAMVGRSWVTPQARPVLSYSCQLLIKQQPKGAKNPKPGLMNEIDKNRNQKFGRNLSNTGIMLKFFYW